MHRPPGIAATRKAVILAIALLALGLTSLAPAGAAAETNEDLARKHFDEGARAFYEQDFSRAVLEFRRAYQYQPDPMILYNISLAHSRLGNIGDAYEAGRTASAMPGMPDAARVRNDARISALSVALDAESLASRIAARSLAQPGPKDPGSSELHRAEHGYEPGPLGWSGIAGATVGVGLVTYALVVNHGLGSDIEAYRSAQAQGRLQEYDALRDAIETRSTRGRIALYSGLGLATIGAGLLIYDLLDTESASNYNLTVGIVPAPSGGMLQISTRFR